MPNTAFIAQIFAVFTTAVSDCISAYNINCPTWFLADFGIYQYLSSFPSSCLFRYIGYFSQYPDLLRVDQLLGASVRSVLDSVGQFQVNDTER